MKRRTLTFATTGILALAAAVFLLRRPVQPPRAEPSVTTSTADGLTLVTNSDPKEVFKKAFWRRPADNDRILHAERREWSSSDGVKKWQWFISVSPGENLLEWLGSNPFSLATGKVTGHFDDPPDWFPKVRGDFHVQQNAEGTFSILLSTDGKQLYATDSGLGFTTPGVTP